MAANDNTASCILRTRMPQLKHSDLEPFLRWLSSECIPFRFIELNPRALRGRQRVDRSRIRLMQPDAIKVPILTSIEPLILDGNHRWFYADYHHRPRIGSWQLCLPFSAALDTMLRCPLVYEEQDTTHVNEPQ